MKLFEKHVGIQNAMVAISAVALVSGCCGNKGGSYSSSKSAPVYSTTVRTVHRTNERALSPRGDEEAALRPRTQ
jgi:predicted transcriptional regulator